MQMHQIRYFLAVCREFNFTRAAKRCDVAQPSLTKAIQSLERELGGCLFHRDSASVRLTQLGVRLKPHFEEISRIAEEIKREAAEAMFGGRQSAPARNGEVASTELAHRVANRFSDAEEGRASCQL